MADVTVWLEDREGHKSNSMVRQINFQPSKMQFGVTPAGNDIRHPGGTAEAVRWSYDTIKAALKRDLGSHLKMFGDSGIDEAVGKWNALPKVEPRPTFTDEVWNLTKFNQWMDGLNFAVGYTYLQEFMDKIGPGKPISYTLYNSRLVQIDNAVKSHANGHFVECQLIGNEAVERQASSPVWPNIEVPDSWAIGCDAYIQQQQHLVPAKAYKASVDWFTARKADTPGVRGVISETGISRVNFTLQQRIDAVQAYYDYMDSVGFSSMTYWAVDNRKTDPGKDWSGDKPGDEPFAAKLASLIQ